MEGTGKRYFGEGSIDPYFSPMKLLAIYQLVQYGAMAVLCAAMVKCAAGPYDASNETYRKQVKALAKTLRQYPVVDSSATIAKDFSGTVNFNLRKPNFVIIHHTSQNSCEQTLQT
ncbi:hypothetical protein, partial [Bradyrhizobium sp. NBAIM08]|uniref:hypothetical protein n=1 Tax=Bradyrhizobium sp. NBAIM08 TaxID=2793815 RepID=UPI001CD1DD55